MGGFKEEQKLRESPQDESKIEKQEKSAPDPKGILGLRHVIGNSGVTSIIQARLKNSQSGNDGTAVNRPPYRSLDDIITSDNKGFVIPELDSAYKNYMKIASRRQTAAVLDPKEWAKAQTSGKPRQILEGLLGRDYAKSLKPLRVSSSSSTGDRSYLSEQSLPFWQYRYEDGWVIIRGPSGKGGHADNAPGEDGLAYNVRTKTLDIYDNKAYSRAGNISEATAIDPEANLLQNLDVMIQDVESRSLKELPMRQEVLKLLRQTRGSLKNGQKIPGRVRLRVVNAYGEGLGGVSRRLANLGVEFKDAYTPGSKGPGNARGPAEIPGSEDVDAMFGGYPEEVSHPEGRSMAITRRPDMSMELLKTMSENKERRIQPPILDSYEGLREPGVIHNVLEKFKGLVVIEGRLMRVSQRGQNFILEEADAVQLSTMFQFKTLPRPSNAGNQGSMPGNVERIQTGWGGRQTGPTSGIMEKYVIIEGTWYVIEVPVKGGRTYDAATGKVSFSYEIGSTSEPIRISPLEQAGEKESSRIGNPDNGMHPFEGPKTEYEAHMLTKGFLASHENITKAVDGAVGAIYQAQFNYTQEKEFEKAQKEMEKRMPEIKRYLAGGELVFVYAVMNAPKAENVLKFVNPEVQDLETFEFLYIAHARPEEGNQMKIEQGKIETSAAAAPIKELPDSRKYKSYLLKEFRPNAGLDLPGERISLPNLDGSYGGIYKSKDVNRMLSLQFSGNNSLKIDLAETDPWRSYKVLDWHWYQELGILKAIFLSPSGKEIIESTILANKGNLIEISTVTASNKNEKVKIIWERQY